jgi:DNA-binding transcriptional ArsR family regulator
MTESSGLSDRLAQRVADTMFALSTPSRLQILVCLRDGPRTVSEIVDAVGMEQSAVSHQLRVLRDHSVLKVERSGRSRHYSLRDSYVGALLDDALKHIGELNGVGSGELSGEPASDASPADADDDLAVA